MIGEADGDDQISPSAGLMRLGLSSSPIPFSFLLLRLFLVLIVGLRYQVLQLAESTAYISIVTDRGWQGGTRKISMHKLIGVLVVVVVIDIIVDGARWKDARCYKVSGRIVHPHLQSRRNEQPLEAQRCVRVPAGVDPANDFIFVDDGVVTNTAAVVVQCVGEVVTRVVTMEAESNGTDSGLIVLVANCFQAVSFRIGPCRATGGGGGRSSKVLASNILGEGRRDWNDLAEEEQQLFPVSYSFASWSCLPNSGTSCDHYLWCDGTNDTTSCCADRPAAASLFRS